MSFFSRLKDRLLRSSSKIEEGLEAIVDDGNYSLDDEEAPKPIASNAEIAETKSMDGNESSQFQESRANDKPDPLSKHQEKKSFITKIFKKSEKFERRRKIDDSLLESLEELLITSDLGVETSIKISASFSDVHYGKKLTASEIKEHLAHEVKEILLPVTKPISIMSKGLQVILVVGVNGSGKTTTVGKLAHQFKDAGKSVKIVAADTFRAAAVEQLEIWGRRANVPVLTGEQGSDPAALTYDSMVNAEKTGTDILMIDTAGRLQNKTDLMEQLAKIVRVLRKVDPTAPQNTLLVLDASVGQNAVSQVEIFQKTADVSGLIMTKLDGTAKGGILVALADRFKLPIHAIGIGEAIDDLQPFDPNEFTSALTGVDKF